jgi:hypothetical protein
MLELRVRIQYLCVCLSSILHKCPDLKCLGQSDSLCGWNNTRGSELSELEKSVKEAEGENLMLALFSAIMVCTCIVEI